MFIGIVLVTASWFNNGLAEMRVQASVDTDYTHGHWTTTRGWVWPALLLRSAAARSFVGRPRAVQPRHGGCAGPKK